MAWTTRRERTQSFRASVRKDLESFLSSRFAEANIETDETVTDRPLLAPRQRSRELERVRSPE